MHCDSVSNDDLPPRLIPGFRLPGLLLPAGSYPLAHQRCRLHKNLVLDAIPFLSAQPHQFFNNAFPVNWLLARNQANNRPRQWQDQSAPFALLCSSSFRSVMPEKSLAAASATATRASTGLIPAKSSSKAVRIPGQAKPVSGSLAR